MSKIIGKVAATERTPTTIDEFCFWTDQECILHPFDVVKVSHSKNSTTFGVIEEISHITDAPSYLTSYISSNFGELDGNYNTERIGMNYVKAKVVGNTENVFTPVLNNQMVSLAEAAEVAEALGLKNVKNPLPAGYLKMYEGKDQITLPVNFNSHFLLGPEGAHLNISGISGLAAKTSYAMFLIKAIQEKYQKQKDLQPTESAAFIIFNVKGKDLLAIDEPNKELKEEDKEIYKGLGIEPTPFANVKYFYPYQNEDSAHSYVNPNDLKQQMDSRKAFKYKYIYEDDRDKLDLLFANVEDSTGTMESIINFVSTKQGDFGKIRDWNAFKKEVSEYAEGGKKHAGNEITVSSWRKFKRVLGKALSELIFSTRVEQSGGEVRLEDAISQIEKNEVLVVDIAKLDGDMQSFVFGDVVRTIYDLKLGQECERDEDTIPQKIVIFVDELNKYASSDVPKDSPVLKQLLDITERGRSLGIVLFGAEQFRSAIHERIKGNCATQAYGRTNAIEISKPDYRYIPTVYKGMITREKQGEYIIENPVFTSLLNIKFPNPVYKHKDG